MSLNKMNCYKNKQESIYKTTKKKQKYVQILTSIDEETNIETDIKTNLEKNIDIETFYTKIFKKFYRKKLETIYEYDENFV